MYVVHTMLILATGDRAVYQAQVVAARWTNKAAKKWTGRTIRDTDKADRITMTGQVHSTEARAQCDALSRAVAARIGMASGPDTFPFSE